MRTANRQPGRTPLIVMLVTLCVVDPASGDSVPTVDPGQADRRPAYLIEVPASVSDILIADADASSLLRFSRIGGGIVSRDERYMSVGLNGVGKQRAWDRKTPLGIYFITEELDTSKLHDKYGVAAFVLDYPNAWDRYKRRTGYGIWLHGVDPGSPIRPPRDTDGCLALPNEAIAELAADLRPQDTPVIIARRLDWVDAAHVESLRVEFRGVLEKWRASLEAGDFAAYLAMYHVSFRSGRMSKSDWAESRLGEFESQSFESVVLDDVLLLRDPEEPGLFLSRFTETLGTDAGPVTTRKRIYWRRDGSDWGIVSEDTG